VRPPVTPVFFTALSYRRWPTFLVPVYQHKIHALSNLALLRRHLLPGSTSDTTVSAVLQASYTTPGACILSDASKAVSRGTRETRRLAPPCCANLAMRRSRLCTFTPTTKRCLEVGVLQAPKLSARGQQPGRIAARPKRWVWTKEAPPPKRAVWPLSGSTCGGQDKLLSCLGCRPTTRSTN